VSLVIAAQGHCECLSSSSTLNLFMTSDYLQQGPDSSCYHFPCCPFGKNTLQRETENPYGKMKVGRLNRKVDGVVHVWERRRGMGPTGGSLVHVGRRQ
jgi:hypothetical protein